MKKVICYVLTLAVSSLMLAGIPKQDEVWVKSGTAPGGSGTKSDPLVVFGSDGLDKLFEGLMGKYGDDLKISFASGTYYGTKQWSSGNNWTIKGSGIDKTVFMTAPDSSSFKTIGFRNQPPNPYYVNHFTISDLTFDFNIHELHKANRVFFYKSDDNTKIHYIEYFYSENLPEWSPGTDYFTWKARRAFKNVVTYKGVEYIQIKSGDIKKNPENNPSWRKLHVLDIYSFPEWEKNKTYNINDVVRLDGKGYICIKLCYNRNISETDYWFKIDPNGLDPRIYTLGVNIYGKAPEGNHLVERVKMINCTGSLIHDWEDFPISIGGDNCLIKDCIVDKFFGSYATLITLNVGTGSKVVNCKVYGNGKNIGYGGWACFDDVFENNYAENQYNGVNIDSLTNRNITFKNNTFKKCYFTGIHINLSGEGYADRDNLNKQALMYKGNIINVGKKKMSGITIENNKIEMVDGASRGAVHLGTIGMREGIVRNNEFTKTSGIKGAYGVYLNQASKIKVTDNIYAEGMYTIDMGQDNIFKDNSYFDGKQVIVQDKPPMARIDIVGEGGLKFDIKGTSQGGLMEYAPWLQKGQESYIHCLSQLLGQEWKTMEITFVPRADGVMKIMLYGQYQEVNPKTKEYIPKWVCFDALEAKGASLKNPDFEITDGKSPTDWQGFKMISSSKTSASGKNYICGWFNSRFEQSNIKVKKGQAVTITAKVKAASDFDINN